MTPELSLAIIGARQLHGLLQIGADDGGGRYREPGIPRGAIALEVIYRLALIIGHVERDG